MDSRFGYTQLLPVKDSRFSHGSEVLASFRGPVASGTTRDLGERRHNSPTPKIVVFGICPQPEGGLWSGDEHIPNTSTDEV